jgi:hypothetical protein
MMKFDGSSGFGKLGMFFDEIGDCRLEKFEVWLRLGLKVNSEATHHSRLNWGLYCRMQAAVYIEDSVQTADYDQS